MICDHSQRATLPRLPAADRNDSAASPALSCKAGSHRGFRTPPSAAADVRRIVVGGGFRLPVTVRHA